MNKNKKYYLAKSKITGWNTYIGGVSLNINTASILATKLGISSSYIYNFTIIGNDIKCFIDINYTVDNFGIGQSVDNLTYYYDIAGKTIAIGDHCFYGSNLIDGYFPAATHIGLGAFDSNVVGSLNKLKSLYIPNVLTIGTSVGNNNVFRSGNLNNGIIFAHPSLQTINSGGVEGDLAYLSGGNTIRYVTNFTPPAAITDLSASKNYSTGLKLSFTTPSSTNAIDYYELFVDGVFYQKYYTNSIIINGMSNETYSFEVISVDVLYNKSAISNKLSVYVGGTDTFKRLQDTSFFSTSDLRVYYPFNGNTNDYNGIYNATAYGSLAYTSQDGISFARFNGVDTRVSPPDSSIWNDTQTIVFYSKIRVSGIIFNKSSDNSGGGWGIILSHTLSSAASTIVVTSPVVQYTNNKSDIKNVNEMFHYAFVFDNANDLMKLYINGVKISEKSISGNTLRGTTIINIGCNRNGNTTSYSQFIDGDIGDFAIIKRALTDAEIAEFGS